MADDPALPPIDPRMVELVRDAIARGVPRVPLDEPLDKPPAFTGRDAAGFNTRDAALIREIARQMVDERLRERRLLSDLEIQNVAKDIAHTIFDQAVSDIKDDMRTEKEIEAIVVSKLREVGIRADEEHIDETRQTMEAVQRSAKRRAEMGGEFVKEVLKALAGWAAVGLASAALTYIAVKGGAR